MPTREELKKPLVQKVIDFLKSTTNSGVTRFWTGWNSGDSPVLKLPALYGNAGKGLQFHLHALAIIVYLLLAAYVESGSRFQFCNRFRPVYRLLPVTASLGWQDRLYQATRCHGDYQRSGLLGRQSPPMAGRVWWLVRWTTRSKIRKCYCCIASRGKGKSTFIRNLLPDTLRTYYRNGMITPENKDHMLLLSTCLIINLEEFDGVSSTDWPT